MALVSVSINHPEIKLSFVYLLSMTNTTHWNFIVYYIGDFCHYLNVPVTDMLVIVCSVTQVMNMSK